MTRTIQIGKRQLGAGCPPFAVAEVGINHNGDIQQAFRMIEAARDAGADAVKFQTFKAEEFCGDPEQTYTYQSQGQTVTESMLAMFKRYEFSRDEWFRIKQHCDQCGMLFLSTPQNPSDLALLLEIGMPAIKIGSDDFTNLPLITHYRQAGQPLMLSCGMADLSEVHQALEAADWFNGHPVILLLCTSQYPTPPADVNVRKLHTLQQAFPGLITGFSDHTQGATAAMLARALGACLFEKHFTLDHNLPGPDHWFSEEPEGLAQWIRGIHQADALLGSPWVRPTAAERDMRTLARRSIVTLRPLAKGEMLTSDNIGLRRPGNGLSPAWLEQVIGLQASRDLPAGVCVQWEDMTRKENPDD